MYHLLTINPGSTSTKVAIYEDERVLHEVSLAHDMEELKQYREISDQKPMRTKAIEDWMREVGFDENGLDIIVSRGGLVRPVPTGSYEINQQMIEDLKNGYSGIHASNLGGQIAMDLAERIGIKAYITDPVACDEMEDVARITGFPEITRRSNSHYLNMKAVTRRVCRERGFAMEVDNFVICHLGGGITVAPQKAGRIIDTNNAAEMGPFSPDRSGTLPVGALADLCFSGRYTRAEMLAKINGQAGLMGYLHSNDGRKIEERILKGDQYAEFIMEAMAYQIAKEIGAAAAVLHGEVKAVIITGGLAYSQRLINWIKDRTAWIAEIIVEAGEDEMRALNESGLRILRGIEAVKDYDREAGIK